MSASLQPAGGWGARPRACFHRRRRRLRHQQGPGECPRTLLTGGGRGGGERVWVRERGEAAQGDQRAVDSPCALREGGSSGGDTRAVGLETGLRVASTRLSMASSFGHHNPRLQTAITSPADKPFLL